MNANRLARLYDRLTVWEHIPLLLAAQARGDDAEYRRLFDASPLRTWRFSEHLLSEQALHVLALIYAGEQLDAAAGYFFALWRMGGADDPRPNDWLQAAEACAYFFAVNADAWRRFCSELDIAPDALTAANHGGWFLRHCEANMPTNAPMPEALQARFREVGRDDPQVVPADSLLESWRIINRVLPSGVLDNHTLDEFTDATDRIVAHCDGQGAPFSVEPLLDFKERVLEGLRGAIEHGQPWQPTSEDRKAARKADVLCNRIKGWLGTAKQGSEPLAAARYQDGSGEGEGRGMAPTKLDPAERERRIGKLTRAVRCAWRSFEFAALKGGKSTGPGSSRSPPAAPPRSAAAPPGSSSAVPAPRQKGPAAPRSARPAC